MMPIKALLAGLLAFGAPLVHAAAATSTTTEPPACTATSTSNIGGFFDLRPDIAISGDTMPPGRSAGRVRMTDYEARGWDYGYNFTMNVCAPVLGGVRDVVGLDKASWSNVSAYYTYKGDVYSLGQSSMDLHSRGRKLVLQYENGSPCDTTNPSRRKSATISFLCSSDPLNPTLAISFVGASPDQCAYFFEARTPHACLSAEPSRPQSGSVGPGGVFFLIVTIAFGVYVVAGVVYNRTISHARGWRQLPNYTLWQGLWGAICDFTTIFSSMLARIFPAAAAARPFGPGRYSRLPGRAERDRDVENRLIDQLDEEWDD